ncbi:hypothetical protein EPUS_03369 [Endocarpon pusillum Z07020]|uniref:Uncharacterized protein n=1 Tax=Endocarpon pusillum (strain Z07020 / HMAS-L-300199) TaxID=1263415 RepID=U1HXM0_ENDPU|nr:uncharacterized protein EPUS_03369 [Endocarpon pusillum Z07020]ERF74179.1 hypothetical protein EPUS_03369 [Endocarpon pusillum Z07020]
MATEYNMADYESDEDGEEFINLPPEQNLSSTALFLQSLLASHNIPHAITGGFSLRLRGSDRKARQIDFAVQPSGGMRQLKEVLRPCPRVRYPNICEGIMKIFVETGPGFDECAEYRRIEVDLKAPGIAGSPLDLSKSRVEITAKMHDGRNEKFTLLDLSHALNGKLKVLYERRYERDFEDVAWFFANYPQEIRKFSGDLDQYGLGVFFDSLGVDERTSWSDIVAGLDVDWEGNVEHAKASAL